MNNSLPKVVLFQEDEKALNYKYKLPYQLDSSIAIKSIEYDLEEFKNQGIKIIGRSPSQNYIYYLHPYKKNVYVDERLGENYFFEEKIELYKKFAQNLGAKSISIKVVKEETEKIEIDANGNVSKNVLHGSVNLNNKKESNYRNSLEISENFELENNYDKNNNIDKLHSLIEEYNLYHELGLTSLVESRDSRETGSVLTKRIVKSEISSEYRSLLNISAQLSSPVFNSSFEFKRSLEKVKKLYIEIEFIF